MANSTDDETIGYTFQWKTENISHCWLKQGQGIMSPTFIADELKGTKWYMSWYLMGFTNGSYIGFYLHREIDSSGPYEINVGYQLAFLGKDGSPWIEKTATSTFQKPKRLGYPEFVTKEKVFATERQAFLPEDTLTVQATIWSEGNKPAKPKHLYARTVFQVIRKSSIWRMDKFSSLKSGLRHKFQGNLMDFDLVLNEGIDIEKKLVLNINSFDERVKYFSFKTSIIDSAGKNENCDTLEYFTDDLKRGMLSSILLLDEKRMLNKDQYFPHDVLRLRCEHFISVQTDLYEFFEAGMTSPTLMNKVIEGVNEHCIEEENLADSSVLMDDLKSMYNDAICSDTELRTSTGIFPAHKNILSARSPVFRRMFSHDMKEKNSRQVHITDLDDDSLHRMLTYMYTNSLGDLQIESACKLYVAGDKYEVLSLKSRCSSFLKNNLCATEACEVLLFADQHQDVDLKLFVQDFILEHDKEVFGSQEWKDFMDTNPKMAADIMYRKVYPM